jgi:O-antigen/teichoic acid export membrane protein
MRLVSNSRWNLLAFGVSLAVNFATIPIVISAVGLSAFGTSGLVLAIYAPFMLIGTVLGQAMVKELSPHLAAASADRNRAKSIFSAGLLLCVAGSVLVASLMTLAAELVVQVFTAEVTVSVNWRLALFVAGLGLAAQQLAIVLQAAIVATQRYAWLASGSIAAAIISATSIVAGSMWMPGYLGLLIGTSIGFAISLLLWLVLVRRELPFMFPLVAFTKQDVLTIAEFGKWQGGAHFAGAVGNQMDRYVLGILAPFSVVGQYNVAMRLQEVVHMGLLKVTEVLFPHFSLTVTDPLLRRASFFVQVSWILNMLGVCALAPLIPLAADLLTLWVNADTAQGGAQILRTLAAAGILGCGVNVYYYFAIGTGQVARIAALTAAHALLTILFTIISITVFGPMAAGTGYLLANLVRIASSLWFTGQYFSEVIRLRNLLLCTVPPLAAGLLSAYMFWRTGWFSPGGWVALLADYILIACGVGVSALLATLMSQPGRVLAHNTLTALRRILSRQG